MLSGLRQKIVLSLAFAALIYLALTLYADAPKLAQSLLNWDWRWLPLILAAVLVNYLLRFVRWHYYLRVVGISNVPAFPSLLIFLSGFSLTMVPGKLGELLKSVLLKSRYGTSISYSASIVAAERLSDTLGMVLLVALGAIVYPLGLPALAIVVAGMLVVIVLMQSRALAEHLLKFAEHIPVVGKFAHLGRNLYECAYLMLSWKPLLIALALSAVAWFGECVALFLVLVGFGVPGTLTLLLQSMFIYGGASLFGAITLLPGGVGATEGSMTSLAQTLIGLGASVAAAATLLVRASTLWFAIILGGLALVIFGLPASYADNSPSSPVVD
ncbi:MAG: flippase-like domain-containing protein [Chloroflexi bacterium]|nr:flippase-like domain-containing protein [Chloroflexota bacterium]